jgi:hypothetical protein
MTNPQDSQTLTADERSLPDALTDKQIDHASKWLHGWQHMRATDKRNAVRELLRSALALAKEAK